jgi:predicted acyltransferase
MKSSTPRFIALDVFRGMTVCFMIIVNTPGNGDTTYSPLLHAHWNGFTPTDLVFPSFMFAVGNAMSFVMKRWEGLPQSQVLWKIFKRTFIIFLLGYLMYWFPFVHWNEQHQLEGNPFATTRIMGVLQRIALGYGIAALMIYYLKPRTSYILAILLILIYWAILLFCGDSSDPYNMLTNAGSKLDTWLFGTSHMYHGEGVAFEPEGVLSTLPSIANVVFGYAAGKWVQQKGKEYEGLAKMLLVGCLLIFIALCWNNFFPINKKLWTGSFVFITVGIDCVILSALIYIIEFRKKTGWTYFFEVFGRNPLFIYLVSELGATLLWFFAINGDTPVHRWLFQNIFSKTGNYVGSFLFAISFMMLCWLVGYFLDKRKIYVRV